MIRFVRDIGFLFILALLGIIVFLTWYQNPYRIISDKKNGIVVITSSRSMPLDLKNACSCPNPNYEKKTCDETGLGTGFQFEDNMFVTNFHVAGEGELKITTENQTEDPYETELVAGDKGADIAIVKIKNYDLFLENHPEFIKLSFADKEPQQGEDVWAIGHPWGLEYSISKGILSYEKRRMPGDKNLTYYLQTDAHIYNGNSGGPLFNDEGEVLGINSMMLAKVGGSYGLAIPEKVVVKSINDLKEYNEVRWVKVGFKCEKGDSIITEVEKESPAEKGGLLVGDKIKSINNTNVKSFADLINKFATLDYKDNIKIVVERDEKLLTFSVTPTFRLTEKINFAE